MRGLPRLLMMFAPMIFRAVSKFIKNRNAQKQAEEYTQKPYNQAEDKLKPDGENYKKDDLV